MSDLLLPGEVKLVSGSSPLLELKLSSKWAKNAFSCSGREGSVEVELLLL